MKKFYLRISPTLRVTSMKNFRSFRQTLFEIRGFQYVRLFPKKSMQKTHVKIPNKVCRKLLKFFMEVTLNVGEIRR